MTAEFASPIVLAHEPPFDLGSLRVRPALREVSTPEGKEILQPRVMQVLVALHRAGGAIVTRDDLTQSCWGGLVVGEDAITRAIGRLRRLATGSGAFGIDTIRKVGFRLTLIENDLSERATGKDNRPLAPIALLAETGAHRPAPRRILPGLALLCLVGIGATQGVSGSFATAGQQPRIANTAQTAGTTDPTDDKILRRAVRLIARLSPDGTAAGLLAQPAIVVRKQTDSRGCATGLEAGLQPSVAIEPIDRAADQTGI